MNKITKQQEFLDVLTDPVKASIKKVCNEINERGYRYDIRAISVLYLEEYKAHVVVATAGNPDALETTKDQFIRYFKQAIPNAKIKVSTSASSKPDVDGQYNIHYFISVGGVDNSMSNYISVYKVDTGYFYCPYVPSSTDND